MAALPPLTALLLLPLLGVALAGLPLRPVRQRQLALVVAGLHLLLFWACVWPAFLAEAPADGVPYPDRFRLVVRAPWLSLGLQPGHLWQVDLAFGLDAINAWLVALAVSLFPLFILASWRLQGRTQLYLAMLWLVQAAVLVTFAALDLFVFYIGYEFMLVPMFVLVLLWGGPQRKRAAITFLLYTLAASLLLLVAMLALVQGVATPLQTGGLLHSLDFRLLSDPGLRLPTAWLADPQVAAGLALATVLAFAVKLPVAPLHSWLPLAHVQAATPLSMLLAALLLKTGGYGLLRISYGVFGPEMAQWATGLGWWGVFSILYGGLLALAQTDAKRVVAYASVGHMGFVLLGLASGTAAGTTGAALQMVNHGVVSAMLFAGVGMVYDRLHHRDLARMRGIRQAMPAYAGLMGLALFAGLGLPGLNTFVSEALVLIGSYLGAEAGIWPLAVTVGAALGVVLAAAYFIKMFGRLLTGGEAPQEAPLKPSPTPPLHDLNLREWAILLPLGLAIVVLGLYPSLILSTLGPDVDAFMAWIADPTRQWSNP